MLKAVLSRKKVKTIALCNVDFNDFNFCNLMANIHTQKLVLVNSFNLVEFRNSRCGNYISIDYLKNTLRFPVGVQSVEIDIQRKFMTGALKEFILNSLASPTCKITNFGLSGSSIRCSEWQEMSKAVLANKYIKTYSGDLGAFIANSGAVKEPEVASVKRLSLKSG